MVPVVGIELPSNIGAYLYPDNLPSSDLEDWQLGGVGLSNPSFGLQVQAWHLSVQGSGASTAIYVDAPNTAPAFLFSRPNITWARLAFDQNMHPVVSYVDQTGPGFWWYDPTVPGNTFTVLPSTVVKPCVTMDDKRAIATQLGTNDVVMCYVNGSNLCYRLQRDRYGTEYVWQANITNLLASPFVNKIGMANNYRLLLDIRGSLYL